jgi:Fe/S biogenesis protein NfuA
MITLTETAHRKVGEFVAEAGEECRGVRVRAARVGKYTFRYQIHLVREADTDETDIAVPLEGFSVYLDPQSAEWMDGATIDFLTLESGSGFQIDNPAASPVWNDPVSQKVQKVIDERVTPVVGAHGGWVELDRVEGNTAYVHLGGGCQGCASASFTLSQGIASVITSEVEEIAQVVDETNHEAGSSPYYAP